MPNTQLKAKVFISCGQQKNTHEVDVAHKIAERLVNLGYDPYIAVEEQTLKGVKENIFGQLESSEYFIFIDFKREQLITGDSGQIYRGSLFSHQELALASYLNIPIIAFQENGVKQDDGLLRFLQSNSIPFTDRHLLPNVIADKIQELQWIPHWKNQLRLERNSSEFEDAMRLPEKAGARFFHIHVRNLHLRKTAVNCYAYLEKAYNLTTNSDIPVETIELKWRAYTLPNAIIGPNSSRQFDAFWLFHHDPTRLQFNIFTDFSGAYPQISGAGNFELTYAAVSENFPVVRGIFRLHIGNQLLNDVQFTQINDHTE
jgi:hypothetical protein